MNDLQKYFTHDGGHYVAWQIPWDDDFDFSRLASLKLAVIKEATARLRERVGAEAEIYTIEYPDMGGGPRGQVRIRRKD